MSSKDSYHPSDGTMNATSGTGEDENVAQVLASVESLMKNMSHEIIGIDFVIDMVKKSFVKLQDNQERLTEQIDILKKDFHAKKPETLDKQTLTIEDIETLKPKVVTSELIIPRQVEQNSSVEATLTKPEPVKPTSTALKHGRSKFVKPFSATSTPDKSTVKPKSSVSKSDDSKSIEQTLAKSTSIKLQCIALKPGNGKTVKPILSKSKSDKPESFASRSDNSRSVGPRLIKLELDDSKSIKPMLIKSELENPTVKPEKPMAQDASEDRNMEEAKRLANTKLFAVKDLLQKMVKEYLLNVHRLRKDSEYQGLDQETAYEFLADRYKYYKKEKDVDMFIFYMILLPNFEQCLASDLFVLHQIRNSVSMADFLVFERRYFQLVSRKVHPKIVGTLDYLPNRVFSDIFQAQLVVRADKS